MSASGVFWRRSALVLMVLGACLAGCDDNNTTIVQGGAALVGNYPATQVIDHLVSDDGRAFNHSNTKINKGLNVFWDGNNGTAIIIYLDEWERLWAHFYDGTSITPAVQLHGPNQYDLTERDGRDTDDDYEFFEQFRVCFINAANRQGDAIILWTSEDRDESDLVSSSDQNDRLYGTYFDRSAAGSAQSATDPTVMYGFETEGTLIDFDNVSDSTDNSVEAFGFVSDSLAGTHAFHDRDEDSIEWPNRFDDGSDFALPPATRSGEATTCLFIVWSKAQDESDTVVPTRLHWLEFNLGQVGNALPRQTSNGQNTIDPGLDPNDGANSAFLAHNKCMIWRGRDQATGLAGLWLTCFTPGQVAPTTIELSAGVADTAGQIGSGSPWVGTNADLPLPANVYGGDHGLDSIYAFFTATGDVPRRIAAAKVPLSDLDNQAAREIIQVDANNGNSVIEFDGDKDPFAPMTLINRSADYIFVAWLQPTIVMLPQLQGTVGLSQQIWTHGIQVDNGNRTLATSAAAGGPFSVPNQALDVDYPDLRITLQHEVADGMSAPRSGIQSDRYRINFAWHELTDDDLTLRHNGLILTPGATSTDQPTAAYALTSGGVVAVGDTGYPFDSDNGMCPIVLDLGTTAGDPLIYYINNANNPTDDTATGAFDELRVFGFAAADGTTNQLVSTNGTNDDATVSEDLINGRDGELDDLYSNGGMFLRAKTTPSSTAGLDHGGSVVHVFWQEMRFGPQSRPSLMTRAFNKGAFNTGSVVTTFSSAHMPALSIAPTRLDGTLNAETHLQPNVHPDDDEIGPFTAYCAVSGSTVGLYFQTEGHFWYQHYTGGSWLAGPEIIDNAVPGTLFGGRDQRAYAFPPRRNGTFDNLSHTLTFHSKTLTGDDQGARRWFVRIHD